MGDLDLLCFEGPSSATNFEDWIMTEHNPAGTIEMKPPEVSCRLVTIIVLLFQPKITIYHHKMAMHVF